MLRHRVYYIKWPKAEKLVGLVGHGSFVLGAEEWDSWVLKVEKKKKEKK